MIKDNFSFDLLKEDSSARLGKINTSRGVIHTPTFMPVGTQGTIKSVFIEDVALSGAQIIISSMHQISSIFLVSSSVYLLYLNTKTN